MQVASLKDIITRKDEEIEQLRLMKDLIIKSPNTKAEKHTSISLRHSSSYPGRLSLGGVSSRNHRLPAKKHVGLLDKGVSDVDNLSGDSDRYSDIGSLQSINDLKRQNEALGQLKQSGGDTGQNSAADSDLLGFCYADSEEKISDISFF